MVPPKQEKSLEDVGEENGVPKIELVGLDRKQKAARWGSKLPEKEEGGGPPVSY